MPKNQIYLDNAATSPLDPRVLEAMLPFFTENFGNPSSIHAYGRTTKAAIEKARKTIADILHTSPSEIFFTSGGTEANNTVLRSSITKYGVQRIISSPLEHHAVLHTLEELQKQYPLLELVLLNVDQKGNIDMHQLESLLQTNASKTLVTLMHGNNEIGNVLDLEKVALWCQQYQALFHSDTVQTMGHYTFDLQNLPIHYIQGSAHKFHGPKGVGFLYANALTPIQPLLYGGPQERNQRAGTENVAGIVGMAKAMELAYAQLEQDKVYISNLKQHMITQLQKGLSHVEFNGASGSMDDSLYHVLNVQLPLNDGSEMLLFNLDIEGIAASAGSACTSGTQIGSHVLEAIQTDVDSNYIRFSFSRMNTLEEVDTAVAVLLRVLGRK
jgi:cysteine desulfurase